MFCGRDLNGFVWYITILMIQQQVLKISSSAAILEKVSNDVCGEILADFALFNSRNVLSNRRSLIGKVRDTKIRRNSGITDVLKLDRNRRRHWRRRTRKEKVLTDKPKSRQQQRIPAEWWNNSWVSTSNEDQ